MTTHGWNCDVSPAARCLNAVAVSIVATREPSALEGATWPEHILHPDAIGLGLRRDWQPITAAMKPVDGTLAREAETRVSPA
jgi:hypothetical protein